ncbi:MAG: transglutaminase-like domain-containing protein [Candidatus Bathyarchaeia archaeon]
MGNCGFPLVVEVYRKRYVEMATPKYIAELINFAKYVLHDPIGNLNWKELLDWVHRHLKYTMEELPKPRAELPIQIIHQSKGRCGEFALLYNGLLLAKGYKSRLVIDYSTLKDKTKKAAGDHVWVEIFINNHWVHVDPTEKRIDQPLMYATEWNKDVNLVYALTSKEIVDVTKTYQPNFAKHK